MPNAVTSSIYYWAIWGVAESLSIPMKASASFKWIQQPAAIHRLAFSVRRKLPRQHQSAPNACEPSALSYSSVFLKSKPKHQRGFSNWVIPNLLMVGQYPGQNPESDGPTDVEAKAHIRSIVLDANVRTFCCLQSEVPSQNDDYSWQKARGAIYLDGHARAMFPEPFTWYAPVVRSALGEISHQRGAQQCRFLHVPIDDLTVPDSSDEFNKLLHTMLSIMNKTGQNDEAAVYLHCWGGRGRAGLVASCLLSLIYPELNGKQILDLIQCAYDTRSGAEHMPLALSKSPQTEKQREFVLNFVEVNQRKKRKWKGNPAKL